MKFDSADHVAEHFGIPGGFTNDQWLLIENYLQFGHIPQPDGCLGCDAAYIRTLIGQMEAEPEPEKPKKGAKRASGDRIRPRSNDGNLGDELPAKRKS